MKEGMLLVSFFLHHLSNEDLAQSIKIYELEDFGVSRSR
jgi:hypothetical protein